MHYAIHLHTVVDEEHGGRAAVEHYGGPHHGTSGLLAPKLDPAAFTLAACVDELIFYVVDSLHSVFFRQTR